jgi:hypothetical protein
VTRSEAELINPNDNNDRARLLSLLAVSPTLLFGYSRGRVLGSRINSIRALTLSLQTI